MEIILYDVVLPKLFGVQIMYFVFTPSKKLKVSDHVCMCKHCTEMKWFYFKNLGL